MQLFLLSLAVFAIVILIMSVGVIFSGRCIRGSCGGEEVVGPNGELLNCDTCPVRKEREAALAQRTQGTRVPTRQQP